MMERRAEALFRFDPVKHLYLDLSGRTLPHITGMLKAGEWVDDTWFTEEGSIRGSAVHDLTADYDLGALDVEHVVSSYRSYLLAYVEAMKLLQPTWWAVEEAIVHPVYRYGGRPDNIGLLKGRYAVLEKKTGARKRVTVRGLTLDPVGIQTALQAILASTRYSLPAEHWDRRAIYLKKDGGYSIEPYTDPREFDEAYRLIKRFGGTTGGEAAAPTGTIAQELAAQETIRAATRRAKPKKEKEPKKGDVFFQRAVARETRATV